MGFEQALKQMPTPVKIGMGTGAIPGGPEVIGAALPIMSLPGQPLGPTSLLPGIKGPLSSALPAFMHPTTDPEDRRRQLMFMANLKLFNR